MTREEAKQELNNYGYTINEQNSIVDRIYDDFEDKIDIIISDINENLKFINKNDELNVNALQSLTYTKEQLFELRRKINNGK